MSIGTFMAGIYWAIFTIRRGLEPGIKRQIKANAYDRKGIDVEAKEKAEILQRPLETVERILKILEWVEGAIIIALMAWLVFVLCAIATQKIVFHNILLVD